jgi:hypothetical protein
MLADYNNMRSEANTVESYLNSLPEERRETISAVRKVILKNLPKGFEEAMNCGMISYQIPLSVYPDTYNGQPLMYAALASQKNHMAVYLMAIYTSGESRAKFETAYKATGKRFDAGKACVRFKKLDDIPLDLIGQVIASISVKKYISFVDKVQSARKSAKR